MKKAEAEQKLLKYEHLKNKELIHNLYKIKMRVVEIGIAETTKGSRNFYVFFELSGKLGRITETLEYVLSNYSPSSKQVYSIKNETKLIESILQGHKSGLNALYEQYAFALYGVIYDITGDSHNSEKILQQTFCYVWQSVKTYYTSNKNVFCWMVAIARKLAAGNIVAEQSNNPSGNVKPDSILSDTVLEGKLLEVIVIKGHEIMDILKKLSITKEELSSKLQSEINCIKNLDPNKKTKNYFNPGILELYCLGLTEIKENESINSALQSQPEIHDEIESILTAILKYFEKKTQMLNITIKPTILALVDYMERLKKGETPTFPPILNKTSTIEDYAVWLDQKEMNAPNDFTDMFVKIISSQISVTTAIVWVKDGAPYEEHDHEFEKFLIVEGSCDIVIRKKIVSLGRGDYFSVPLHTGHLVRVTSKTPCKLILQKIAA